MLQMHEAYVTRNHVFYVYDMRTQMTDFVASFAVRGHAEKYASDNFDEHGYVTDRRHHHKNQVWDGRTETK